MKDGASFERVYDNFQDFHAFFAASFGRKHWRERSGNYLQGLLVQAGERRNAENLSESVGISARAMQGSLAEARWSDDAVIGRLQEYLAPRLGQSEAVAFQSSTTGGGRRPALELPELAGPRALGLAGLGLADAHGSATLGMVLLGAGTWIRKAHRLGVADDLANARLAVLPSLTFVGAIASVRRHLWLASGGSHCRLPAPVFRYSQLRCTNDL